MSITAKVDIQILSLAYILNQTESVVAQAVGRSKGSGAGRRIRTLRATTDSELAMLRSADVSTDCSLTAPKNCFAVLSALPCSGQMVS